MFNVKIKGKLLLFADDAVLISQSDNINLLNNTVQEDLNALLAWLTVNKLTLNTNKTKYMIFSQRHINSNIDNFKLFIHSQQLNRVSNFKYLGLLINENLSWAQQVNSICRKLAGISGAIKRLGNKIHENTKTSLYYSLCNSYISYLMPEWATSATQTELNSLQVAQNNAIRSLFKYEYSELGKSTEEIRMQYKILNIKQQIKYNNILLMYKIDRNLIKINHAIDRTPHHDYRTRNASQPRLATFRTTIGKKNIFRVCTEQYATLPQNVLLNTTLYSIKFIHSKNN